MEARVDHAKCSWLLGLRRHQAYDAKASCTHTEELQDADRSLRTHLSLLNRMDWIMAAKSGWNCVNKFTRFSPIPSRAVPFTKLWHRSSKTFQKCFEGCSRSNFKVCTADSCQPSRLNLSFKFATLFRCRASSELWTHYLVKRTC